MSDPLNPQTLGRKSTGSLPRGCIMHNGDEDGDGVVDDDAEVIHGDDDDVDDWHFVINLH